VKRSGAFDFPTGGTVMGPAIRGHDWAATPIGPSDAWPQPLKTLVTVILGSSQPMFVAWGPERTLLYNDAYAQILAAKHPAALGADILEVWDEIRDDLAPIVGQAYAGQPVHMDDIAFTMNRRGHLEEAHFAFSYTPVRDADGAVAGLFCACLETTEQVLADRRRAAETERQRRLFERAPGFIAILSGPNHRFEFVNAAYRRLVGDRIVIGQTVRETLPDVAGQGFFRLLDQVYRTGERHVARHTPVRLQPDPAAAPAEHFVDFIYEPITDEAGAVTGIFVEGYDVTEAHRAQQALAEREVALVESEDRFRTLAEAAPVLIFAVGPDGGNSYVNQRYQDYTGLPAEALLGQGWRAVVHPDDIAGLDTTTIGGTTAPDGFAARLRIRRHDGAWRWFACRAAPLRDAASGRVVRSLGACLDIDDGVRAEAALRTSEARFRTALAIETVGAIYFDMEGTLTDANDAFLRMSGYTRDDLEAGKLTWQNLTPPEWLADSERAFAELKANGSTTPYEKEYIRKDGSRWWALFAAKLLPDGTGFEFVLDISDRKAAEARLRELAETLETKAAERAAELAAAQDQLRQSQKMEAIGQLTGGVAHDFNNLLTVIRSSADLLQRPDLPEAKRRRYIDAIAETADRAAKLTSQLLAFARRQALQPEIFDAADRIAAIAEMLHTVLGSRIRLEIEARCPPCHVEADPGQFETALVNMAVNARDAMDGEGTLRIVVDAASTIPAIRGHAGGAGAFVTVAVCDTGSGIAPADLGRVFEPFYTTKEVGKGTGLGLSQVFGFAKQSGGEVHVESAPGRGTTFTLYLPRVEAANDDARPVRRAQPIPAGGGRVLVVEDNAQVGEFAAQLLEDLGYRTVLAGNAAEALARLEADAHGFDLVFSDVVMPGMGGVEFGQTVRRRWPSLPVVLTSGYSHVLAADARHGFPLLHKPYSVDGLSRVLRDTAAPAERRASGG
jgi:PAS domain S-box-containing protein